MRKWGLLLLVCALGLSACKFAGGEGPALDETGPQALIYATISGNFDRFAVEQFNTNHTDVQIQVEDYSEDGRATEKGVSRLLTEINAGHVPDIIEPGYSIYRLPIRQLAQKGYLEDLWPYIENDPQIGRKRLMESPLKAAEIDGKLYEAFSHVRICTLAGREDVVGKRYSWTLDELLETFNQMPENSTISEYCFSKSDIFYYICRMALDGFVNFETGECSFDSDEFRMMLEFSNRYPLENNMSGDINLEIRERTRAGQQMLSFASIGAMQSIQALDARYNSRTSYPGFPTVDGSVGSYFNLSGRELLMSALCKNKEAAWEFIREEFLPFKVPQDAPPEVYDEILADNAGIPVNKEDFIKWTKYPNENFENFYKSTEYSYYHVATEEEVERAVDLFNSVDKFGMKSPQIYTIINELCGAYFAGDKTLDETVDLVQRRVTLYVNELR